MAWLVFVIVVFIVVLLHELGHYWAARACKIKVESLNIGFGPVLLGHTSKKTGILYALRPIPLGGYCGFSTDEEDDASILNASTPRKLLVYFAGPAVNIISFFAIAIAVYCAIGTFSSLPVATDVSYATEDVASIERTLMPGDKFVEIDGTAVQSASDVKSAWSAAISRQKEALGDSSIGDVGEDDVAEFDYAVPAKVERNGEETSIVVDNAVVSWKMEFVENHPMSLAAAAGHSVNMLSSTTVNMMGALADQFGKFFNADMSGKKDETLAAGATAMGNMLGDAVSSTSKAFSGDSTHQDVMQAYLNIESFCFYVALLSMVLGVFNLIPLPGLDGAKILVTIVEGITGKKVNVNLRAVLIIIVMGVFALFTIYIIARDIFVLAG